METKRKFPSLFLVGHVPVLLLDEDKVLQILGHAETGPGGAQPSIILGIYMISVSRRETTQMAIVWALPLRCWKSGFA